MAETVISKLAVQIAANTAQFNSGLKSAQNQFNTFTNSITKVASTLGIAFGIQQVASFTLEVAKLSGEAEGVSRAFERLPDAVRVMREMKEATGGTVSELELMKAAVQANNFQIPIQQLGRLFEFATLRAQQTGQSVDYLVQSIILGIGRKSPLILDNLGISAVRLREKLRGASAEASTIGDVARVVGDIAEEELGKMAGFSENAATKLQRLDAEFTNLKVSLGDTVNGVGLFGQAIDGTTKLVAAFSNFLNGPGGEALELYLKTLSLIPRTTLSVINSALNGLGANTLNEDLDIINKLLSDLTFESSEAFKATNQYQIIVAALSEKAKAAGKELVLLSDETGKFQFYAKSATVVINQLQETINPETFHSLNEEVKNLREQFDNTPTGDILGLRALDKKIEATLLKIELLKNKVAGVRPGPSNELTILSNDSRSDNIQGGNVGSSLPQFSVPPLDTSAYLASLQQIKTATVETFDEIGKKVIDVGPLLAGALTDLASALGRASVSTEDFGKNMLSVIGNFAQQFGAIMISTGIGIQLLESGNAPAMIAGGVILVAAGAALSAANDRRSNISSEMRSGGGGYSGGSTGPSFNSVGNAQNSQMVIVADVQIKGDDLYLLFQNVERQRGYTHG